MQHAILIPTDFSENAWVATQYGAQLAEKYNWSVHLLHVYQNFGGLLATPEFNESIQEHQSSNAEAELAKRTEQLVNEFPGLSVTSACIEGGLSDTIIQLAEDNPIQFIVMGTKGASGIAGELIGSNTFELIQKSPIGVIAIPAEHKGFSLKKLGLLTNFKDDEIHLLDTFISRTNSSLELSLLHVWEGGEHPRESDIAFWASKLSQTTGVQSIDFYESEMINRFDVNNPIPECIADLTKAIDVDLLLISYARRRFFRALFAKSLVKTLAHTLSVPAYFLRTRA
ncbi:MAG: universal stress protein [Sphingobacterium sp.]